MPPRMIWAFLACGLVVGLLYWLEPVSGTASIGEVLGLPIKAVYAFDEQSGATPVGSLTTDGRYLFGRASVGGAAGGGVVFRFDPDASKLAWVVSFSDDKEPARGREPRHDSMYLLAGSNTLIGTAIYNSAGGSMGNKPEGGGVLFAIDSNGRNYRLLHRFGKKKEVGRHAHSCFALSSDGKSLYGATSGGGPADAGTLFAVDVTGPPKYAGPLYAWPSKDKLAPAGNDPHGRPVVYRSEKSDILLGTTRKGGEHGLGVIYRFDTTPEASKPFQVLHAFAGAIHADGATPYHGNLTVAGNRAYGLTREGGNYNGGVAFVTTNVDDPRKSQTTVLWHFGGKLANGTDGWNPYGTLLLHEGWYYGTTNGGGAYDTGSLFRFKLDPTGLRVVKYQQLASFDPKFANQNGAYPRDNLIVLGNFLYGMASHGGNNEAKLDGSLGTIFALELPGDDQDAGSSSSN